jgi:mRNA interferase MazF
MTRRTVTCDAGDVITVPFPFTDRTAVKVRPALVMSGRTFNRHGHSLLAMITTASHSWPLDTSFAWSAAGLPKPSIIRMKLFTLNNTLIQRRIGRLGKQDWATVQRNFHQMFR